MSNAKRSKKENYKKLYILIILIVFITILIGILNSKKHKDNISNSESVESEEIANQNITETLQDMEERDRMEYYIGMFLEYIESNEYDKAYNLLYEEFRKTYFPTLESFEQYIPTIFSEMTNIEHDNIERNGDVYVLWIYITDAINGKPEDKKEMNIVIKENDYNDFVLSFSVI